MPGIFRPYTLVDVLGTLNDQSATQQGNDVLNGLGNFAQTGEAFTTADSLAATHQAATLNTWDSVTWGTFTWS